MPGLTLLFDQHRNKTCNITESEDVLAESEFYCPTVAFDEQQVSPGVSESTQSEANSPNDPLRRIFNSQTWKRQFKWR